MRARRAGRQFVLGRIARRPASTWRRSRNRSACGAADRGAQRLAAAARPAEWTNAARRMSDRRAHQRDRRARGTRAPCPRAAWRHSLRRAAARAARASQSTSVAVELQRCAGLGQHLFGGSSSLASRCVAAACGPELGQRARSHPRRASCADLALEPQHVLAQPLAFEAARRQVAQQPRRPRLDSERTTPVSRRLADQHQREVVAQAGQVAVARRAAPGAGPRRRLPRGRARTACRSRERRVCSWNLAAMSMADRSDVGWCRVAPQAARGMLGSLVRPDRELVELGFESGADRLRRAQLRRRRAGPRSRARPGCW